MTTISGHTTRASGTILTAAIYNADHVNHIVNAQSLNTDKIEGATPPVVDGDAVLFDGTGGSAFRSATYAPADEATSISVGTGLTGGGDLSDDRTIAADIASQAAAEAGSASDKLMTPERTEQWGTARIASQAAAEAGADTTEFMTPQRTEQWGDARIASQAQAEAGTNDTEFMTALKTAQAISSLTSSLSIAPSTGDQTLSTTPWDTGVAAGSNLVVAALFTIGRTFQISLNGGSSFTTLGTFAANTWVMVGANGVVVTYDGVNFDFTTIAVGSGTIQFRLTSNTATARVLMS